MTSHPKVLMVDGVADRVRELKTAGQRVAHCHGCFDLMHPGHIRHFEAAKRLADVLVVTVSPDRYVDKGPNRPVFNETLRAESIASLECVDFVAINQWPTAVETIKAIRPDYFVKGQEFAGEQDVTGKLQQEIAAVKEIGGEMRYTDDIVFSSTRVINEHFDVLPEDLRDFLSAFKSAGYADAVWESLEAIKELRILVIGDAIIDDYHYCMPMNKSPKANVITSQYLREEAGIGGALCIGNHLSSFCDNVTLLSCFGSRDDYLDYTRANLSGGVELVPVVRDGAFTTQKRRYIDNTFRQKVFEIHFFDDTPVDGNVEDEFCQFLTDRLSGFDLVIVGDFGHGVMTKRIIDTLCDSDTFLSMTVQTNSANFGFNYVTKYPRADYVAIDEREVRLAMHDRFAPVTDLIGNLSERLKTKRFAVTLGRKGSMIRERGRLIQVPIVTRSVVDTVGAGDAFLALSAPLAKLDAPPEVMLFLGNIAGAMAANIVGNNEKIAEAEFKKFLSVLLK
ncbi:MAG: adenylyltransferase/cytidyltransferase family protein [Candidatus Latescibacterota bacterium]|nr:MAG: adenylyltransferase/cytidyltransferase family protein [Candidatus Latescibacterota bacterium]